MEQQQQQQLQSKFHSATELNHDINSSTLGESNASIRGNRIATVTVAASGRKHSHNISSCDSINLETIAVSSSKATAAAAALKKKKNKKQRRYTSVASEEDATETEQEDRIMKIRMGKKKVKSQVKAKKRPHFRIDWRQLSYYQRPHSFLSKCLANLDVFSPSNSKQVDQQMELDERHSEASSLVSNPMNSGNDNSGDNGEPKRILNSLDGCFRSGELSAILGPSGAGKSTFLSTLFGSKQESAFGYTKVTWLSETSTNENNNSNNNNKTDSDLVTTVDHEMNGCDETMDDRHRSLRIAFLPQHDHLLHHLTVYETLMFASKMKNHERQLPAEAAAAETSKERKNFHHMNVKRVAKMLKLTECLNTRCGKLSGGQYKRVSIGQELLSEPDVIILDEPTSGLDAMTCLTTIQTLKSIVTKHPMSIILTIHQPDNDVFSLFDKVYVIAQGGMAIYEGPPNGIFPTLAEVSLIPPRPNYNPARFIVENAFVPEPGAQDHLLPAFGGEMKDDAEETTVASSSSDDDDEDTSEEDEEDDCKKGEKGSYFKRSVQSLTDTIMGKETQFVRTSPFNKRDTIRRPLLNLGIRTFDGQLITSEQLANMKQRDTFSQHQQERIQLLRRLNMMQKAKYETQQPPSSDTILSTPSKSTQTASTHRSSGCESPTTVSSASPNSSSLDDQKLDQSSSSSSSSSGGLKSSTTNSSKSDYSSASACSMMMMMNEQQQQVGNQKSPATKSLSLACLPAGGRQSTMGRAQPTKSMEAGLLHIDTGSAEPSKKTGGDGFVVDFGPDMRLHRGEDASHRKMRRKFDKRLSAKHNCSKQTGFPILYHALLLTHRTWLSIVRDPIFFGIQACMHTLIPIVLATIFGSVQEEGCPRIGNFDLVDFAYSDSENLIQGTVRSIRQSIGNIGIVFFEMFVICFAINCITALVFPLDMYVLLKEYRNGWYSLRSYFMGRTLADLPVPVVLHSIGMAILYFMTGQPHSLWRFSSIVLLVILASLVAQSVGLTIGALLMKSSQSAVLAAAGIVAPFFALSGFIVRIHTLPGIAQLAANMSYLYHLLNGFIILRYGYGRCPCTEEDFEQNSAHQIPGNLHTMASMWIGTYSDEYANSTSVLEANHGHANRSNVDPNIDVVDKMMTAFKMANSYGHQIDNCQDVLPYAMLDFNQRDQDIYYCFMALAIMVLVTRLITFSAIYYKIRSFA